MIKKLTTCGLFLVLLTIHGCIEPFSPPEINSDENYLVVDGFLNIGSDTSRVILSRTQNTSAQRLPDNETGATIVVESENGEAYDFEEKGKGLYTLAPQNYSLSSKYRIHITTQNKTEYFSDYIAPKRTPPIDSVTYKVDQFRNAVVIYVNTHDAKNETRFYRWKFEQTYDYRTAYYSALDRDLEKQEIVTRRQDISHCWRTLNSNNIALGSTIKLTDDIIKDLPINVVPIESNWFLLKYSILVKQYALSQDAFEYWTSLAKTTQGSGSLFDPQPSQVTGNIKNAANPKERVFGYCGGLTEEPTSVFIEDCLGAYPRCESPDTLGLGEAFKGTGTLLNYYGAGTQVLVSSASCADCRLQGGTIQQPAFWK
jgi:hypothetical protein